MEERNIHRNYENKYLLAVHAPPYISVPYERTVFDKITILNECL